LREQKSEDCKENEYAKTGTYFPSYGKSELYFNRIAGQLKVLKVIWDSNYFI
jgi:hypothetical protein